MIRQVMRWMRMPAGMILSADAFTLREENPFFEGPAKYVVFPGLALTGLTLWQWPPFYGLLRRKGPQGAAHPRTDYEGMECAL